MCHRVVVCAALALAGVGPIRSAIPTHASGSGSRAAALRPDATRPAIPRTPEGRPDLQGVWDFRSATPLERPRELDDQEFLDDQTVAAVERRAAERLKTQSPDDPLLNTPAWWLDYGARVVATRRSSLIVDPPDGRIPPMTPEGLKRQNDWAAARAAGEDPEGLSPWDRCITRGLPDAMLPGAQNNNLRLVQTPRHIAIVTEMIHEARIVRLDSAVAPPQALRTWLGASRGRWEDDTLRVETTNFAERAVFRGAGPGLRLIEWFQPLDANTIEYRLTVDDGATWTRPWTVALRLVWSDHTIYEYACHEGNHSLRNSLSASRFAASRPAR
jgi:hypothetical protein